ncbi:MAG: TIGR02147 family protein [Bdellovibrionaceae bacterium]|jgi:uncharacterized protein (TIGR02147 family)|nr:TIGR02147 family protein [Pseudobdellovibrionaceae bacterium]
MKTIFLYSNYVNYLRDLILAQPNKGRGLQSALANEIGCQQAYLSKILAKNADLSFDQAYGVCAYFILNDLETDYFVNLVLLQRAGTTNTKKYLKNKLKEITNKSQVLSQRIKEGYELNPKAQLIYYSNWLYAATHILTSIKEYATAEAIANKLAAPISKVKECLIFLEKNNLIIKKNGSYDVGQARIHLANENPLIVSHHRNWRLKALDHLTSSPENLHYSSVVTFSKSDSHKVKEILIQAIEDVRKIAATAKDEAIYSYGVDFFEL